MTVQTALFLDKKFNEHEFKVLHVAQGIRKLERDFTVAREAIAEAELIVFTYPVYTFLVPYQLNRFIELMKENEISLEGKYVTQISTSKHFYDITAHKFIEENAYDMKARYLRGLSADMEDLLEKKGQEQAVTYFQKVLYSIEKEIYEYKDMSKFIKEKQVYQRQFESEKLKSTEKDVLIVTNVANDDERLRNMIDDFKAVCSYEVHEVM